MDPSEGFRRQQPCALCDLPLSPGENWGCVNVNIPIFGAVEMVVQVHKHVHIRCSSGYVKWLALGALGRATAEMN